MPAEIMVGQPKKKTSLLDAIYTATSLAGAAKGAVDLGNGIADAASSLTAPPSPPAGAAGVVEQLPEMQSPHGGTLGDALSRRAQLLTRGMTMRR